MAAGSNDFVDLQQEETYEFIGNCCNHLNLQKAVSWHLELLN